MCKLFINADPELWVSKTHSLRIDGMVTSVRMENAFWHVLAELAERDGMNLPQMITRLYHESIDAGHDLGNFTSFLTRVPIASLNADRILTGKRGEPVPPDLANKSTH